MLAAMPTRIMVPVREWLPIRVEVCSATSLILTSQNCTNRIPRWFHRWSGARVLHCALPETQEASNGYVFVRTAEGDCLHKNLPHAMLGCSAPLVFMRILTRYILREV